MVPHVIGPNGEKHFLGKHDATEDHRDLPFASYIDTDLIDLSSPPPAATIGHAQYMPQPRLMLGNGPDPSVAPDFEGAGDCVFAGITNMFRLLFAIASKGLFPAIGLTAIQNYSEVTGYVLNDADTDNGTDMRKAMNWLRKTGYKDANGTRHKIGGYGTVNVKNWYEYLWAVYLSDGGALSGIQFPNYAMTEFNQNKPWSYKPNPDIEGGHCINVDLDVVAQDIGFKAETWARDQAVYKEFLTGLLDEAYFTVDSEGMVNGKTLEGFDSQQLLLDAKQF
jgi:hypothetical protein